MLKILMKISFLDPSTALKASSEERGKKSRSGSTLSRPRAEARGSRRVDLGLITKAREESLVGAEGVYWGFW